MVVSCSAPGCEYRRGCKIDTIYKDIDGKALFSWLPATSKPDLRSQWIVNTKRAGQVSQDKLLSICWQHFTPDCFERD